MIKTLRYSISEIIPYIDWQYFFFAWQMPAKFASLTNVHECDACRAQWISQFEHSEQAQAREAIKLFRDAQELLFHFSKQYKTTGRVGLFEANSQNEDIIIYHNAQTTSTTRIPMLRQQHPSSPEKPNLCLADFLRPLESKQKDTIGIFATTIPQEMENSFSEDTYKSILVKTICDRLAEATSERLHEQVRKIFWGYSPNEHLSPQEMFNVHYQGIRPAVGYPSLPDQSINFILNDLINFSEIGIRLTTNGAMKPHGSVSGLMFAHPQSTYFAVGPIGADQFNNYAQRRSMSTETLRKYLSANL